jgi:translation initiation factor eIF-2B subunit epsilon
LSQILFSLSDKACRTCKIGNNTLLGPSTQVRDEAQVIASTIGARCLIGTGTVLRNAYLFDDVTIGPDCVLESCIVGAGVQVGEGSRIARGSLVADGVKLGPGTILRPFDRISKQRQKSNLTTIEDESDEGDDDSELEEAEQSTHSAPCVPRSLRLSGRFDDADQPLLSQSLGTGSEAFVWPRRTAEKNDEGVYENELESFNNRRLMRLGAFSV